MTYNDLCLILLKEENKNKDLITIRCVKEVGISKDKKIIFSDYKDVHILKFKDKIYVVVENWKLPPLKLDNSLYNKLLYVLDSD